jgi:AraC-like DNA-binding protein
MSETATVIASLTRTLIDFGVSCGLDREGLVRAGQLDAQELERHDGRVPQRADAAVWSELERALGSYGVGLAFAETKPGPRAYGVVALRDMCSGTFGEALRRHCRHHRVIKDDVRASLLETPHAATVFLSRGAGPLGGSASMAEAALAPYVIHARDWTGHPELVPEEVRFEHEAPAEVSRYEALFRCPVRFAQSATSIRFARHVLDLPLLQAERDACEHLEASAADALARLQRGQIGEIVFEAVVRQLGRGDTSLPAIARSLGVGARTLQRRLREESISYHDVVDVVRHHRALELLAQAEQPVAWISEHLGFSDPRAFRRAFARWTGMSPDRYRRLPIARHRI